MTDRPVDDTVDERDTLNTHPPSKVPDEEELKTERAYKNQPDDGPQNDQNGSKKKDEKKVDEASDESFPASDPPSY